MTQMSKDVRDRLEASLSGMADSESFPFQMEIPLDRLKKNDANPNVQDERTFNATVESVQEEGWIQPMASVVPVGEFDPMSPWGWKEFSIVAGHHRYDAAVVLGHDAGPCWVLDPEKFDQDRQDWVMVKANILSGDLDPMKFTALYSRMAKTYGAEVLQSLMGFTSEDAFKKVYRDVKRALPPALQKALDDQKDEIKTIDDLSLVLNRLFREYGETLPSNMMVFSWAGKEVLWVRTNDRLWEQVLKIAKTAAIQQQDVNAVIGDLLSAGAAALKTSGTVPGGEEKQMTEEQTAGVADSTPANEQPVQETVVGGEAQPGDETGDAGNAAETVDQEAAAEAAQGDATDAANAAAEVSEQDRTPDDATDGAQSGEQAD